jgi:hypothetical protein
MSEIPFVSTVRLKFGPAVTLIDLSSGGAKIEIPTVSLQPGSMVVLEMTGTKGRRSIPARVQQCQLASRRNWCIGGHWSSTLRSTARTRPGIVERWPTTRFRRLS